MKLIPVLVLAVLTLSLAGCPSPTPPSTQPDAGAVLGTDLIILAARVGLAHVSQAVENGYAQGKLSATEYTLARGEEAAALASLDGLQAKVNSGTPVTQAEINAALASFLTPLNGLIAQYALTTLPPAQVK